MHTGHTYTWLFACIKHACRQAYEALMVAMDAVKLTCAVCVSGEENIPRVKYDA